MSQPVAEGRPELTPERAREFAREVYGLEGEVRELPSDRDRNFRIRPSGFSGHPDSAGDDPAPAYVLKVLSASEDPAVLDLQHRALERVAEREPDLAVPRLVETGDGRETATVRAEDGRGHPARLLTWLPGRPMAGVRPRLPRLLHSLGRHLGRLDRALEGLEHPAAERDFHWDPHRGAEVVQERMEYVEDASRRELLDSHLGRIRERLGPLRADLPVQVIHNDANDRNVLVEAGPASELRDAVRLAGVVDYGDMIRTWRAAEPAVAAAYAALGREDPARAVRPLVEGYHDARPLAEAEVEALAPLMALRLCMSVAVAAKQKRAEPENEYLTVTEDAAWRALERLEEASWSEARCLFRETCGLPPSPRAERVAAWLEENGGRAAPVVDPDPAESPTVTFDLSVGSLEDADLPLGADAAAWTDALFGRMEERGAEVGLGRYGETRRWYTDPVFQEEPAPGSYGGDEGGEAAGSPPEAPEPRTVHLGVDLFVEPGTPVRAPLAGTVHSVADHDGRLDYGPTLILEHDAGGTPFFTLYGHLDPGVLDRWEAGDRVERGERIARVGRAERNGGWAPHLHLQVAAELLGRADTFPGVARPAERELWTALSPDPNLLLGIEGLEPAPPPAGSAELLPARERHLGPNLSLSYERPLTIVRGSGPYLFDQNGRRYLDGRNNVPHVGHAHPRVARAAARQEATLNTDTRYLHPALTEYVGRLLERFPDPLDTCWLTCTGSEANELALRMARAWTGTRETVVLEGAYHGNTNALVEISPYKYRGEGGFEPPGHVHEVPMPDPYRGRYRGRTRETGQKYAEHVMRTVGRLDQEGRGPAAFVAEPLMGCGGQIVPPPGFLEEAFRHVREAGGICVADEVQTGFGRVGTDFWAFETQGVVPDVVTIGKPMGNGHPVAAVVTTSEVAERFDTGMEYFNTFAGSPVSCRVGSAVLDVIEEEGLQERALRVGDRLEEGLGELAERHPVLGDVRGRGLFLGAELVRDPEERLPATDRARYVVERLLDHRILLSTDGPDHNVLKIKPPLAFGPGDADRMLSALDAVLGEDPVRL